MYLVRLRTITPKAGDLTRLAYTPYLVVGVGNDPTFQPYQDCTNPSQLTD